MASEPSARPEITVVISTLGNYETLTRVLAGFAKQSAAPASFDVLVVVDAADPEPSSVEKAIDGAGLTAVKQLRGPKPGLSANRNAGLEAARAPVVLFTDNDTIPSRRLVSEHLAWHERYPQAEVGVLGLVRWAPELHVSTFMRWLDTGIQFDFANIVGVEAGWGRFVGANVSVKQEFARRVGPFDQDHFPYGYEDTDWAYRASLLGFRLMYNRHAVVDHLRPMTLEFWQRRARRVAFAERMFQRLHPELEPWFYTKFSSAVDAPAARGRGIHLAPFVPRRLPWLGPRVWGSVDLKFKQAIAPHFLAAWDEAAEKLDYPVAPDLSEFATGASGPSDSPGPK